MRKSIERLRESRLAVAGIPYLWVGLFFLLPFFLIFKISLSESVYDAPPYLPIFHWASDQVLTITLHVRNYMQIFEDKLYFYAFGQSIMMAGLGTLGCLLIGYPMAYGISKTRQPVRTILLLLIILPFWTSFLIRVYAWIGLLGTKGVINNVLLYLGIIQQPLEILYNRFSMFIGIVYSYLPFMIMPLYASLEKMDTSLLEAAEDLGASPLRAFLKITLPLSMPGVVVGSMLVFIPAVGEVVIPELLGGPENVMIGRVLWGEFFDNQDWPIASAIAIVLLLILVVPMIFLQRMQLREER
ncbi:MAG: ABC transporter permease subunit [Alphaproteobacteria bacterium]